MFNFFNLADKPEYIEEVVSWIHNEWGNEKILIFGIAGFEAHYLRMTSHKP